MADADNRDDTPAAAERTITNVETRYSTIDELEGSFDTIDALEATAGAPLRFIDADFTASDPRAYTTPDQMQRSR